MALRSISKAFFVRQFSTHYRPAVHRLYSQEEKIDEKKARTDDAKAEKTNGNGEAAKLKELESRIKTLENEALQYKDFYVRAVAEQENIRKRLTKEIENEGNYTISKFAKEMLEVHDNLCRALENTKNSKDKEAHIILKEMLEGVNMTKDILKEVFGKFGISEYVPHGDKFDPNLHEALLAYEDKNKESGTVGQVFVNGFKIKDRILRCAKVGVVKK